MSTRPAAARWRNPVTLALLARAFQAAGVVLALPSAAVLGLYAWHVARQAAVAAPRPVAASQHDGLVGLLIGAAQVLEGVAGVVSALADIVLAMAAFAAGIGLLLGAVCWCTGRALRRAAWWARAGAALLLAGAAGVSLLAGLSFGGTGLLAGAAAAVACALGVQTLWAGTAGPLRSAG